MLRRNPLRRRVPALLVSQVAGQVQRGGMPVEVAHGHSSPRRPVQDPAEPGPPGGRWTAAGLEVVPRARCPDRRGPAGRRPAPAAADRPPPGGRPADGEPRAARLSRRRSTFPEGRSGSSSTGRKPRRHAVRRQPGSGVDPQLARESGGLHRLPFRHDVRHQFRLPPGAGLRRDAGPADQRVSPRRPARSGGLHPRAADLEAAVAASKDLQLAGGVEPAEVARVEDAGGAEAPVGRRQGPPRQSRRPLPAGTVTGAGQRASTHQDPSRAAHGHEAGGIIRLAEVDLGEVRHHAAG